MAAPTEQTVRGDFNGSTFRHQGVTTRASSGAATVHGAHRRSRRQAGRPRGELHLGVAPLQQYLIVLPAGACAAADRPGTASGERWSHLLPDEDAAGRRAALDWSLPDANTVCIACHTTDFEKRYDADVDSSASRWSEPDVSMPVVPRPRSRRHVAVGAADRQGQRAGRGRESATAFPRPFRPGTPTGRAVRTCHCAPHRTHRPLPPGQRGSIISCPAVRPSALPRPRRATRRGVCRTAVPQNKMYQKGVGCWSCHDPHPPSSSYRNAVCRSARPARQSALPAFAGAADNFDTPRTTSTSRTRRCLVRELRHAGEDLHAGAGRPDHSLRIRGRT